MGKLERLAQEEKEGEELHRKLYGGGDTATATEEPTDGEPSEPTGEPAPGGQEPEPTPEPTPEPEPTPTPAPADPSLQEKFDKLTQQHRVLQGKYNAEVPRLHAMLRELQAENEKARTAAKPAAPADGAAAPQSITDIEKEISDNYGDEYLTRFRGLVDARVSALVDEKLAGLHREVAEVNTSVQATAHDRYVQSLTGIVPYWPEYVNDPRFSEYLNQSDAFSGRTLYDLMSEAVDEMNAPRVAQFYKSFHAAVGGQKPAPAAAPKAPANDKGKRVEPAPRGAAPPAPEPKDDGWMTYAEMDEFTRKSQSGYYRTRPEEFARDEARLNKAIAARKIRP